MNIKIEALKACIFMLIGAFLCKHFDKPDNGSNQPAVEQNQDQACKVVVKKTTKPNGEVDEVTEFLASQAQAKKADKPLEQKNLALLLGVSSSKRAALEVQYKKFSYEVLTDFNKDHVHVLKYKVIEF